MHHTSPVVMGFIAFYAKVFKIFKTPNPLCHKGFGVFSIILNTKK